MESREGGAGVDVRLYTFTSTYTDSSDVKDVFVNRSCLMAVWLCFWEGENMRERKRDVQFSASWFHDAPDLSSTYLLLLKECLIFKKTYSTLRSVVQNLHITVHSTYHPLCL